MAYLLDFVDGNIARYVGKSTYFGKMIDGLVDSLTFLLFIALAFGNVRAGHSVFGATAEIALGVATGFVFLWRVYFYLRVSFVLARSKEQNSFMLAAAAPARRERSALLQRGRALYFGIISGMPLLLLLAVMFDGISFYLGGYCVMFFLATLFEVAYGLRQIRLMDE